MSIEANPDFIRLSVMDYLEHNRHSWNDGVMSRSVWAQPVDSAAIDRARAGSWQVILTPTKPVPQAWLGDLTGKKVLCLASGGGQQAPILAAAGADVVSFDLSDEQLRKDRWVAQRDGLAIRCVRGDMADLGCFASSTFDLIFHPVSNVFVPDLVPVWRECHRVMRPGGFLLAGFMNPAIFLFDHDETAATGELLVRHPLPYADPTDLDPPRLQANVKAGEPLEFSHSLASQIGGQLEAGFVIVGLYEDRHFDDTWMINKFMPVSFATRAVRPL